MDYTLSSSQTYFEFLHRISKLCFQPLKILNGPYKFITKDRIQFAAIADSDDYRASVK